MKTLLKKHGIYLLLIFFLVCIAYINSLDNEFISDDLTTIVHNKNITDLNYIITHPMRIVDDLQKFTVLQIFGMNPAPFRIVNILFHLTNAWLVYVLLYMQRKKRLAFIAAALFAVHPVLTESVAWISGGTHVQYATFFLISFLFYVTSEKSLRNYIASVVFFLITLIVNSKAVSLPLVFLLYEFSRGNLKKNWRKITPYFLLSSVWFILFQSIVQNKINTVPYSPLADKNYLYLIFVRTPVILFEYFRVLLIPFKLTFYHTEEKNLVPQLLWAGPACLTYLGLIVYFLRKNRFVFFWLVFFLIPLIPVLTPFGISAFVAERYVYLSSLSFVTLAAYLIETILHNQRFKFAGYLLFTAIVVFFLIRTILRNSDWHDNESFWIATVKASPESPSAHNSMGDVFFKRGDYPNAIVEFENAIKLNPNLADAYNNLAASYALQKQNDKAITYYKKAENLNPNLWQIHQNLGVLYYFQGKFPEAEEELKKAIALGGTDTTAYTYLQKISSRK